MAWPPSIALEDGDAAVALGPADVRDRGRGHELRGMTGHHRVHHVAELQGVARGAAALGVGRGHVDHEEGRGHASLLQARDVDVLGGARLADVVPVRVGPPLLLERLGHVLVGVHHDRVPVHARGARGRVLGGGCGGHGGRGRGDQRHRASQLSCALLQNPLLAASVRMPQRPVNAGSPALRRRVAAVAGCADATAPAIRRHPGCWSRARVKRRTVSLVAAFARSRSCSARARAAL